MDISTISSTLLNEDSNLKATDIIESQKYLEERGYQVESMIGCGSFSAVLLAKNISSQK